MKAALYITGAVLELGGIVLVGSPDLFPQATRLSRWLDGRYRRTINRLRLLVGRPRSHTVTPGAIAGAAAFGARGAVVKSISPEATLDEKVEYLLLRAQEAQETANRTESRLADLEAAIEARLDTLRAHMAQHTADEITTALEKYLPLRITGAVALALGLACATAGNFAN